MTLVKYLKASRSAPLFMLAWQAVFMALGLVMVLVINGFLNEDPDYACMGSIFVLIGTAVGIFARGNMTGGTRFHLAVSMGQTRRSYLLCDPLVSLGVGGLGVAVAWCAYQLESWLYTVLYPGYENDIPLDSVYQLKYILPVLIALALADIIFTAITLRFGVKTFSVVWVCFCFSFLIIPRAIEAYGEGSRSLFGRIGGVIVTVAGALPVKAWIGVGAALLLMVLALAVNVFRKAEAKL